MRLIDRYLLRELLTPLAYCLSGFIIFYTAFDLIFHIAQFQDARLQFLDVVKYYVVTLPAVLSEYVIPVSLLLALLYALTNHSRYNELIAIRAAGIGVWRLALPYLAVGMFLGLVALLINETVAPTADERARDIMESHSSAARDPTLTARIRELRSDDGKRDWVIDGGMSRATGELSQPQVRWIVREPGAPQRIHAASATFSEGQWTFVNADVWFWDKDQSTIEPSYRIALPETPAWIRSQIKLMSLSATEAAKRPQLSIKELVIYLRLHPNLGPDKVAIYLTQLYGRIAAPFTCLAVVLIAFPFGARSGRHNVFVGVASGIFLVFSYFILQRISFALGTAGYVPALLAAWLPNLLFGAAGIILMLRL